MNARVFYSTAGTAGRDIRPDQPYHDEEQMALCVFSGTALMLTCYVF
ncbi:hypothetical protein [Spirosoma montaniterrae]|nr:hypothetical protein [Spirosoma montaniterrae]